MTTSTSGRHLSRLTYVPLFLQTVKIYIFQFHQSPSGPIYTRKTLRVFRVYKTDLNMKTHFKTTRRKKLRIPSKTNLRRYIVYHSRLFPGTNDNFPAILEIQTQSQTIHLQICTIKNIIQLIATDQCIQSQRQNYHSYEYPPERLDVTLRPAMLPKNKKAPAGSIPTSVLSTTFPLLPLLLLLLSYSACGYYAARLAAMRMFFPS